MLGDQLIKDEKIALTEIIKNSYDADSLWVKISFENFGEDYQKQEDSKIVIEDAGHGMSEEVLRKHWLNPATPSKLKKRKHPTTLLGRTIQGEKGIGRFSLLKLGATITVITKEEKSSEEYVVIYDFSRFDEDFLGINGDVDSALYLDELKVKLERRAPEVFIEQTIDLGHRTVTKPTKGTKIIVSHLKGEWSEEKIASISNDIKKLEPIFLDDKSVEDPHAFSTYFYVNNQYKPFREDYLERLNELRESSTVIRIKDGRFDQQKMLFSFKENGVDKVLNLEDSVLGGLKIFERADGFKTFEEYLKKRKGVSCGPFEFSFDIFDFNAQAESKYRLSTKGKEIIRNHRIYLYRDGIRVYPYGEPNDDWLRVDAYRGTISAGKFLSNDQVVGYVFITQKDNPNLKDKTNREGLIEEGYSTEFFITLLKLFLAYVRSKPYERYRINVRKEREGERKKEKAYQPKSVQQLISELRLQYKNSKALDNSIDELEKQCKIERTFLVNRAEKTEDLAGVGLAVEAATHDINMYISKAISGLEGIAKDLGYVDRKIEDLIEEIREVRSVLLQVLTQLTDVQVLFRSTKQRRKNISVDSIITKIVRIFKRIMDKENIEYETRIIGPPLIAYTTDAVLLQLLLNLLDNSIYWLKLTSQPHKKILIILNGNDKSMVIADNGPGINDDDEPYIFEAFYSGKGEIGRGLGLYIAKQILLRHNYKIELINENREKVLSGANFRVLFS
jgi:signal transduction histidine kinase